MSQIVTETGKTLKKSTNYRWIVLLLIFVAYTINYADRSNIGVVLPFIKKDFSLSNLEAGALASFFFLGYAISQIPAGFWFSKFSTRGLVSLSILGFSAFTYLIGTALNATVMKWFRLGLGLAEGPTPVGMTTTINSWFPPKEKATATGVYIAATMFAPIIVPPIGIWITLHFGWRYVFYLFAIPGIVMSLIWYLLVKSHPEESPFCSAAEVEYIRSESKVTSKDNIQSNSLGWLDKLIRAKRVKLIDSNGKVFTSWNIWGDTLAYFMMVSVLYGLMTWIPSYLVNTKGYSFMKMGFVASTPWIGGFLGSIIGGWLSDKVFLKRRKPTMIITALTTAIMMVVIISLPQNVFAVSIGLFMTGFLLNIGWPAFTAYPMGVTNANSYPVAIALVNSGGNLGGFFSPMIVGALLDAFKSYNAAFLYFGLCAIIGFILILTLDEPIS
ncbi:MFS transporter [Moorella thermoacetica]|uniref:Glucarate transporter n=2 Tax=Neomoorella thermoacetica TaxID=1525 RepID=A0A1D7X7P2_NEOTH|nr:MFS transporter [Moorella thermoacetica]AKX93228.1 putative glucarate transporter [Moorella thermoacetica]AKX95871.1 putative glucarate transporter [Moorella thermoacetica]AOQ22929.1 putative glucarate transporter [Moorella thermoacetica]OIQ08288.1 putative glucarate transporter [Moorella thermoacetica]OIQ55957.1 putative glucarate transporter [Moorella thermoacetica]